MSVSTLSIGSGAATPVWVVNFSIRPVSSSGWGEGRPFRGRALANRAAAGKHVYRYPAISFATSSGGRSMFTASTNWPDLFIRYTTELWSIG